MLDTVTALLPSTIEIGWEQRFEDPVLLREGKERKGHRKRK